MIKVVTVKNFKSLRGIRIRLAPLTILAGLNGSGKSSLLQSLLLLRQSVRNGKCAGLVLKDDHGVSLGTGKDVLYQFAGRDEYIEFSIRDDSDREVTWKFRYERDNDLLPLISETAQKSEDWQELDCGLFTDSFQYIHAEHFPLTDRFPRSESRIRAGNIGSRGEFAAHYLAEYGISRKLAVPALRHPAARSSSLLHQVDAWMTEISPGIRLVAEDVARLDQVRLAYMFATDTGYTNEISPLNTGFGISYALPVLLAVLKARQGDTVLIENPESHLHPRGQAVIGQLLAKAASTGIQCIVETHSDHLVNGTRVAVKQGIPPSVAGIFYFERVLDGTDQYSRITEISLDKNGELSSYPKGFLDEWNEQLMQLL